MSLEDIPESFADFFGINVTASQLLLSLVVIFMIMLPVLVATKGKNIPALLIFTFLGECLVLALGWLPFWIMIMTIFVTVLPMASGLAKAIGGD